MIHRDISTLIDRAQQVLADLRAGVAGRGTGRVQQSERADAVAARHREEASRLYLIGDMARDPATRQQAFALAREYERLASIVEEPRTGCDIIPFPRIISWRPPPDPGNSARVYFLPVPARRA